MNLFIENLEITWLVYFRYNPYHPWDWYIYLHEWLVFVGFDVGKYTVRPMDPSWVRWTKHRFRSVTSHLVQPEAPWTISLTWLTNTMTSSLPTKMYVVRKSHVFSKMSSWCYCWWFRNPAITSWIWWISHYLPGFIHARWLFGISSINCIDLGKWSYNSKTWMFRGFLGDSLTFHHHLR